MAEFDSSMTDKVVNALHKFTALANQMLKDEQGLEEWGQVRWHEYAITLQWYSLFQWLLIRPGFLTFFFFCRLYDYHPNGNEEMLIDTMKLLRSTGQDWALVFDEKVRGHGFIDPDPQLETNMTYEFQELPSRTC